MVFRNADGSFGMTKIETAEAWDEKDKGIEFLGKLGDLNAKLDVLSAESETVYTDKYTHTMIIKLGQPVYMKRKSCDGDPRIECSYGLHVGATKYVEVYGNNCNAILVCLVNPANVVAVPMLDNSKIRVSEYFPIALATFSNGKIDIVAQKYFESDYQSHEESYLEEMIAKVLNEEKPFEKAINAEEETRSMSELMKILETRLLDLN